MYHINPILDATYDLYIDTRQIYLKSIIWHTDKSCPASHSPTKKSIKSTGSTLTIFPNPTISRFTNTNNIIFSMKVRYW